MQSQFSKGEALLVAALIGYTFTLAFIFYFVPKTLVKNSSVALAHYVALNEQKVANLSAPLVSTNSNGSQGLPVLLRIPKIKVNAAIEEVGITPEGAVDTTKGPDNAGWFNLGPRPGEDGSSIIDGHAGWKNDIPAVFDDLDKLEKGDKIYVEDDRGMLSTFNVREIKVVTRNADATEVFVSPDLGAHLNLITCTGVWDDVNKRSSHRIIVFADKEISQ